MAEHVRPARVLLQAGSGRIQISYSFRTVGAAPAELLTKLRSLINLLGPRHS